MDETERKELLNTFIQCVKDICPTRAPRGEEDEELLETSRARRMRQHYNMLCRHRFFAVGPDDEYDQAWQTPMLVTSSSRHYPIPGCCVPVNTLAELGFEMAREEYLLQTYGMRDSSLHLQAKAMPAPKRVPRRHSPPREA